jgi:hypothetical protein
MIAISAKRASILVDSASNFLLGNNFNGAQSLTKLLVGAISVS